MTAFDIDALIAAADLADRTDRLMLADACEEAGRDLDAFLLDSDTPLRLVSGRLAPADPVEGGDRVRASNPGSRLDQWIAEIRGRTDRPAKF